MHSLLISFLQNGFRQTIRDALHPSTTLQKQPSPRRETYARIRQRDKRGHSTPTHVYQLVDSQDGEKTYRRVHRAGNAAKQLVKDELVLRKISGGDSAGKKQRRRQRRGRELSEEGTEEEAEEGREEDRLEETRVDARRKDTLRAGKLGEAPKSRERSRLSSRAGTSHSKRALERPESQNCNSKIVAARADGVKSPFRQPDMDVRSSHAFVFGGSTANVTRGEDVTPGSLSNDGDVRARAGRSKGTEKTVRPGSVVVARSSVAASAVVLATP